MAGKIKALIDTIIDRRAKGDEALIILTRTKLLCKGINPDNYTTLSDDDITVIKKLQNIASEMSVTI